MDQPPSAPPVQPEPMRQPAPESKWPTVLGIVAIVFGAVGALFGFCGVLSSFLPGMFAPFQPEQAREVAHKWSLWTGGSSIFMAALAVLLLVGGIRLMKRRPEAVGLLSVWAIIKMVVSLIGGIVGVFMQQETMESMAQGPQPPASEPMMRTMMLVGSVIGLLWAWALPVFVLVWFNRPKIKDEISHWDGDGGFPATDSGV